ncbi:Mcm10 replication factor, partial [Cooperia oncophora]
LSSEDLKEDVSAKRSKLTPLDNGVDLDALLKKKSMHDKEANKAQGIMAQKHLDALEAKEKVETFVTECMSVKDVKVVNCKKCGYTAQRQSDLCMREGHCITRTTAEKRFFKCLSCHRRIVVFSLMPTKPCKHCDENGWVRVAMKDERKVLLENEKLAVRGEERKFVNS